ncbi:MAG TPA: hypothetical protein VFQ23_10215, partial [Anaerolineales bacterium]|nr:hypothetical protein [Anaerolineales bacterium]
MKKHPVLCLLFTFIIGNCTPAPASPTPYPTATVTPTRTPLPTQTAIPTATPYPSLQSEGPYLIFTYDNKNFTIMDADGNGRKQFQLPNDGYIRDLEKAVSPDGKWLAYFTGLTDDPYDISLNLFNLETEGNLKIANLIAKNFPQNLEPAIRILKFAGCINNEECKLSLFKLSLFDGIKSLEWSPDGKQLAFAAQIDGPSSDIYSFGTESKTTQRLTMEPENIDEIIWSPNGEKIIYKASIEGSDFYPSTIWHLADLTIAMPQNSKSISEEKPWRGLGWFNEDLYFISTAIDSPVYIDTGYINIDSGEIKIIWPHITESLILDSKNNRIILSFMPYGVNDPEITAGTYLLSFDGSIRKISDEIHIFFYKQGFSGSYFAVGQSGLVRISSDGNITYVAENTPHIKSISPSPNNKWTFVAREEVLELFSENLDL